MASLPKVIVICGATAVGKTAVAIKFAQAFNGEIISADSRQFYKEIAIGTAKPSAEELASVPHHYIDTCSISQNYTSGQFERDGRATIKAILQRGRLPIVVGGSGMYIDALINGLDTLPSDPALRAELNLLNATDGLEGLRKRLTLAAPAKLKTLDLANPVRLIRAIEIAELTQSQAYVAKPKTPAPFDAIFIGLELDRRLLYEAINARVDYMIEAGLEQEVRALANFREMQALQTVGYREWWAYFDGQVTHSETVNLIKQNTRRYAKRQLTWLRNRPEIQWFSNSDYDGMMRYLNSLLGSGDPRNTAV